MAENLGKIVFIIGLSHRNENFTVSLLFDLKKNYYKCSRLSEKTIVSVLGCKIHNLQNILQLEREEEL